MKNNALHLFGTLALLLVGAVVKAQNVPINLSSGWNWISYPRSEVMSLEAAMQGFQPAEGDKIKSMSGSSVYQNGSWQGNLDELVPGEGYMYYSSTGQSKSFVFGGPAADPSVLPEAALEGEFTVDANGTKVRFSPGNLQCRIDPNQETQAIVGTGTSTSMMPINTYYKYSLCQMIFKASELADAGLGPGPITDLAFESYSKLHYLRERIMVWMSATTLTAAPTTSVSTSGMTEVFYGSLIQQEGWTPVYFSTPFTWDGESNLLVTVLMNHGSYDSPYIYWQCSSTGFSCFSYTFNDNNVYAPNSYTYSMTTTSIRPNTRFNGKGGVQWRFANNQTDYIGEGNSNIASSYEGWFDLFGWGTSGHPHGSVCYQPWSVSTTIGDYYAYGTESCHLYDQTGQADWGCNSISNGGNQPDQWRTLTSNEWYYIAYTRTTPSGKRYAKACVNNVNGLILLPDNWATSYYTLNNTNTPGASFSSNTISSSQWATLEQHGAVFLPAAGFRNGATVNNVGGDGRYWTAVSNGANARYLFFQNSNFVTDFSYYRYCGLSVRLVCQTTPRVRTMGVTNVGVNGASVGTLLSSETELVVSERGVCYSTTPRAMVTGDHVTTVNNIGYNEVTLTGLQPNTTYYVRAYAKISGTYRYGNEQSFTTLPNPEGVAGNAGLFSVSATEKVVFSQGNLQYRASTDTWRFAEHQWDYLGVGNQYLSSTYDDWIDLFGWGTSGWNNGNLYFQPWSCAVDGDYSHQGWGYGPTDGTSYEYDLTGAYANADWGHNPISNGGNTPDQWRTLTKEEWTYLFSTRSTTSGKRYAKATVNGVNGVILLPDDWETSYYTLNSPNTPDAAYSSNAISAAQWVTLDQHGAVFMPAAGSRHEYIFNVMEDFNAYWSASCCAYSAAYHVIFSDSGLNTQISNSRYNGFSVRLVRSAQ